jgi:hypothetical protein
MDHDMNCLSSIGGSFDLELRHLLVILHLHQRRRDGVCLVQWEVNKRL